jgi:hypothetical protein
MRARLTPVPMPMPASRTFDPHAGTVDIGTDGAGQFARWQLWDAAMPHDGQPQGGALHGVVLHDVAEGGTNLLRVLVAGVTRSGTNLVDVRWVAAERANVYEELRDVAQLVEYRRHRLGNGARWASPTAEMPLHLVVLDGVDLVGAAPLAADGLLLGRLLDSDGLVGASAAGVAFAVGARRSSVFAAQLSHITGNRFVFDEAVRYLVHRGDPAGPRWQVYRCPVVDCPVSWAPRTPVLGEDDE